MVICSNCGAKFQKDMAECPYCGQIYIPGAEKEYMDNLQEIKEDMSNVAKLSEEVYQKEIKKTAKKTGVIIAVLVLILLVGIGILTVINSAFSFQESEEEVKARILWEREYFPVLDEWFEEENYQAILEFMEETYEEKGYSFFEWEHYYFIRQFENYQICMDIKNRIAKGAEISEFDAGELLYCGMSLINYESENSGYVMESYSDSEKETLNQWKQEAKLIFAEELRYSEEMLKELEQALYEDGFLSYEACCDFQEEILERIQRK